MPNRIIREGILSSEKIASLSWEEEVFYRRLMSVVDDYGRTESNAKWLRSRCYPVQVDSVSIDDVERLLRACEAAGLVIVYKVGTKEYLQIDNFQQRQRVAKYPPPPGNESGFRPSVSRMTADGGHLRADDGHMSDVCGHLRADDGLGGGEGVFEVVCEGDVLSVQTPNQNSPPNNSVPDKPEQITPVSQLHEAEAQKRKPGLADEEFLAELQKTGAYEGIDIDAELRKMHAWLLTPKGRGRKLTRQFVVNWLNKVDRPMQLSGHLGRSPPKRARL